MKASTAVCASRVRFDAQYLAGRELARQIAPLLRGGEEQAFGALSLLPENMLCLLESPEGWAALAAFIVQDDGRAGSAYQPPRH